VGDRDLDALIEEALKPTSALTRRRESTWAIATSMR
jgi:hypothetical protein